MKSTFCWQSLSFNHSSDQRWKGILDEVNESLVELSLKLEILAVYMETIHHSQLAGDHVGGMVSGDGFWWLLLVLYYILKHVLNLIAMREAMWLGLVCRINELLRPYSYIISIGLIYFLTSGYGREFI